jgi:hypothetical protein
MSHHVVDNWSEVGFLHRCHTLNRMKSRFGCNDLTLLRAQQWAAPFLWHHGALPESPEVLS